MSRYIDSDENREDFMNTVYNELSSDPDWNRANRIIKAFDDMPTADVVPVVSAHWIGEEIACSHCGRNLDELKDADSYFSSDLMYDNDFVHFCPFCGAKMDDRSNT